MEIIQVRGDDGRPVQMEGDLNLRNIIASIYLVFTTCQPLF